MKSLCLSGCPAFSSCKAALQGVKVTGAGVPPVTAGKGLFEFEPHTNQTESI